VVEIASENLTVTNEREGAGDTPSISRGDGPNRQPIPPVLYKYQEFAPHTLENLVRRQIWFSKPETFNDPFDCAIPIADSSASDADWERELQAYKEDREIQDSTLADFFPNGSRDPEVREVVRQAYEHTAREWQERTRTRHGVCCFSSVNSDLLMWGHYADKHRGLCLGFRTDTPLFVKLHPVQYSTEVPEQNPTEPFCGTTESPYELLRKFLLVKSQCWAYEQEWRLVHVEGNKAYGYGAGDLVAVYFGLEMPEAWREVVGKLLDGTGTEFYKMKRHPTKFAVVSEQMDFHPTVVAMKASSSTPAPRDEAPSPKTRPPPARCR